MRRDTILVVDDTPETLSFLSDTLDHAGFTVLIATDGLSALELVDQITPDVVLMDALMPGIDGFETCRRLKNEKFLSHLPIIFMTGLSETQHVVQGLAAGGVDYVTKPLVVDELLARIQVHLANARAAHGTRTALDMTGRFLLATDNQGRLLWCTPKAKELLSQLIQPWGAQTTALPPEIVERLRQARLSGPNPNDRSAIAIGKSRLQFSFLSSIGPDELLYRLIETSADAEERLLKQALALTSREADVLVWISRGKSNREIGEILTISPRTVNKHLEQIFAKLGVENRASATAKAITALSR